MLVREAMSTGTITVRPETATKAALRLLDEHSITSMPVVRPGGRIVGVVSEADLVRGALPHDGRTHLRPTEGDEPPHPSTVVADVMNRHALTVEGNLDLADAVDLMTSTSVKSVPVVDGAGRVVGMLSRSDVVHLLVRRDELISQDLEALHASLGVDWLVDVQEGHVTVDGPVGDKERALAKTAAATVAGVTGVTVLP